MEYENFDLWIDARTPTGYPLRGDTGDFRLGEGRGALRLEAVQTELDEGERRLARRDTNRDFLVTFGSCLARSLFADASELADLFAKCCEEALGSQSRGVRLRLRIEAPEIAALPWELLYWRPRASFLATSVQTPLVRYVEMAQPIRSLATKLPIQMLMVIPNADGLDVAREKATLQQGLADLRREVTLSILDGKVTLDRVGDALRDHPVHVLHFVGHGDFRADQPSLLFNAADGSTDYVDHQRFGSLFRNHPTLKLVVLNSCKGAAVSSSRPLLGMAPQLIRQLVPAVVAMQYAIHDEVALRFAREFYGALFRGAGGGGVDYAVSYARNSLATAFPDDEAVGTPVLYMHTREGSLFDLVTGSLLWDVPLSLDRFHAATAALKTSRTNLDLLEEAQRTGLELPSTETVDETRREIASLERRLRLRALMLATGAITAVVMLCLLWVRLFDLLTIDTRLETYTMWLGDLFVPKTLSDRLALVTIDAEDQRRMGEELGPKWRTWHGALVDRLSLAGAKVVAFDLSFQNPAPEDDAFAAAMGRARTRGTAVILGVKEYRTDGTPRLPDALLASAGGWASLCIGGKLGYAREDPVLVLRGDEKIPSLALAAVAAASDRTIADADVDMAAAEIRLDGGAEPIGFSLEEPVRHLQHDCALMREGDRVGNLLIDLSPLERLREPARRFAYRDVVGGEGLPEPASWRGRIVFVGSVEQDLVRVFHGLGNEERLGMELHADAANTMLNRVAIRPLSWRPQFAIMLVLATAGALLRSRARPAPARGNAAAMSAAVAGYAGVSVWLCARYRLLLNVSYHVGAFFLAYWAFGRLRRRVLGDSRAARGGKR